MCIRDSGKISPIPRIFGVTGTLHLEHEFFAWLDTHLAGPRDYWIATCQWTQRKYATLGIPLNRVFLAYLGTDVKNYPCSRTGALRNELKIPANVPLVGMVSLFYPPKWYLGSARGHNCLLYTSLLLETKSARGKLASQPAKVVAEEPRQSAGLSLIHI